MTLALVAQAAPAPIAPALGIALRPVGRPASLPTDLFGGLEGDVRSHDDTIVVTYYNAPNVELLRQHYEHLPAKLAAEGVDPRIPWLYNYQLDFRFA